MDRWVGGAIVLAATALFVWVLPDQIAIPRFEVGGGVGGIAASPLFFPRLITVLLGALGLVIFLRGHSRSRSLRDGEGFVFEPGEAARLAGTAAILIAYTVLLETVGYLLLTPVALVALCVFLGFRRPFALLLTVAGFTALVYFGFRYGMKILLPEGLLV